MEFFNQIIPEVKETNYETDLLSYSSGFRVLVGDPSTFKTTFSLWSMQKLKERGLLGTLCYVDFDSKTGYQANKISKWAKDNGWLYITSMNPLIRKQFKTNIEILGYALKNVPNNSGIIVDTWNKLMTDENDNKEASLVSSSIKDFSVSKDLLVDIIGHFGKDKTKKLRGASSVLGDATYSLEFHKDLITKNVHINILKDSLGQSNAQSKYDMSCEFLSDNIASANINLIKNNTEVECLTPQEMRDKLVAQQKRYLTLYIASYLSKLTENPNFSIVRNFILKNVNTGINGKKLTQIDDNYIPTKIVRECFSETMETEFQVYKEGKSKFVLAESKDTYLSKYEGVNTLPTIYTKEGVFNGK